MNRSESEIEQLAELRQKLDEVLLRNKALEKRISEKESEAQCAVAWAQTASDTVVALEEQLDEVEKELSDVELRLKVYENGENPWRLKEESYRHVLQQLNESQTREAEMFQQAEDMQRTYLEVNEKLVQSNELCTWYENEISRLKGELSAGERRVSELVSECSTTAQTWERYNNVKNEMDRTLTEHLTSTGMNGNNSGAHPMHSIEKYRLEDQIHELEQALARAEMQMLEEQDKRAKLQDENKELHNYIRMLQEQLRQ